MHAQEKSTYISSAVDASPHKIAVIFVKDHYGDGSGHLAVAWKDSNDNLVFAQMPPGTEFSGDLPKDTFGNPVLSGVTLKALSSNYQTVEAIPLDLVDKVPAPTQGIPGPTPEYIAERFTKFLKAQVTGTETSMFGGETTYKSWSVDKGSYALRQALSDLSKEQNFKFGEEGTLGSNKEILQNFVDYITKMAPSAADALGKFGDFAQNFPNMTEGLATLATKHLLGENYQGLVKVVATLSQFGMPDVPVHSKAGIIDVGEVLKSTWNAFAKANPEQAKQLAPEILTSLGIKILRPGEEGYDKTSLTNEPPTVKVGDDLVDTLDTVLRFANIKFDTRTSTQEEYNWLKENNRLEYNPEYNTWVEKPKDGEPGSQQPQEPAKTEPDRPQEAPKTDAQQPQEPAGEKGPPGRGRGKEQAPGQLKKRGVSGEATLDTGDEAALALALAAVAVKSASADDADSDKSRSDSEKEASHSDQDVALTEAAKAEPGALDHEVGSEGQFVKPFMSIHEDSVSFSMFAQQETQAQDPASDGEGASHSEHLPIVDAENVNTDYAASQEAPTDAQETPSDNAASQEGLIDGEEEGSHSVQVALQSDAEDASKDAGSHSEQPGIDPDEDVFAPGKEPANAEQSANLTAQDQAASHGDVTVSDIFSQDSLPSSIFANLAAHASNQEVTLNQEATLGQISPETPPDAETVNPAPAAPEPLDLANAVPNIAPVVHHDDLAP
jgi:hypothetical protein